MFRAIRELADVFNAASRGEGVMNCEQVKREIRIIWRSQELRCRHPVASWQFLAVPAAEIRRHWHLFGVVWVYLKTSNPAPRASPLLCNAR